MKGGRQKLLCSAKGTERLRRPRTAVSPSSLEMCTAAVLPVRIEASQIV